ncbi:hypothetical protein Dsin_006368 [Dipteronia sinensis]|uniref:Reverse transcriptase zinc-binding domain-containing protein n=1 Tax=Dipteronia sinensis TaxID=43782 RepID=A0AAE0EFK2_9ROSI|nr:hypothetical protein Dsin_006368 [Dipteronia sinensis]
MYGYFWLEEFIFELFGENHLDFWRSDHLPLLLEIKEVVSDDTSSAGFRVGFIPLEEFGLEASLRKRVGDGTTILIYKDRWIPRLTTPKVSSPPVLGENALVSELLTPTGGWDVWMIMANFPIEDSSGILSLPVGLSRVDDSSFWHYDQQGIYSVKSGYWVGCAVGDLPSSSGLNRMESWWKFLWPIQVPLKVKLFIWRACHNWIPTNMNLARRGLQVSMGCPVCNCSMESTLHDVWGCSVLKVVRESYDFGRKVGKDDQEVSAQQSNGKDPITQKLVRWIPPIPGIYKMNTDAALDGAGMVVGVGIVIRDSEGFVMAASAQTRKGNMLPFRHTLLKRWPSSKVLCSHVRLGCWQ